MGRYQMIKPYTYKVYEGDCKQCAKKFFKYLESNSISNNNNFVTLRDIDTNQTYTFEHRKKSRQIGGGGETYKFQDLEEDDYHNNNHNHNHNHNHNNNNNNNNNNNHNGNHDNNNNNNNHDGNHNNKHDEHPIIVEAKLDINELITRINELETKVDNLDNKMDLLQNNNKCKGLICPPTNDNDSCVIQ